MPDMNLLRYCKTDKQREFLEIYNREGSMEATAKLVGKNARNCFRMLAKIRGYAAAAGYAPDNALTNEAPEGFIVKKVSQRHDADGNYQGGWTQYHLDDQRRMEMLQEVAAELSKDVKPLRPAKQLFTDTQKDLLNLHVLTDAHIGMLAWHEEGGADWDLGIAERTILDMFDDLLLRSPPASTGLFCQLGDGLHSDSLLPVTPGSGHVLDQDGRYHKVVRTAIRVFRDCVRRMLEYYGKVVVLMGQGNHDLSGSVWLQEFFKVLFENNKRVEVITSPLPFYAYQWGECLLGFHHGHKQKLERLPETFIGEFRSMYGSTRKTFIHCGHRHEQLLREFPSAVVEQHPTIAARDAYTSHSGYNSQRLASVLTYHKTKLFRGRVTNEVTN